MPYDRHHYAKWNTADQINTQIKATEDRQTRAAQSASGPSPARAGYGHAETTEAAIADAYALQELQAALVLKGVKLPPDPEEKNDDRAENADAAIRIYRAESGADEDNALCLLLCCLMHWADRNAQNFEQELQRARAGYAAETEAPRAVA